MSCMICNPTCGMCRPPMSKAINCQACGRTQVIGRYEVIEMLKGKSHPCLKCGADLAKSAYMEPVICSFTGLRCAFPCGRSTWDIPSNKHNVCTFNVSLETLKPA